MFGPLVGRRGQVRPSSGAIVFFLLTAARNGRIPDVPQPRIEGLGFKSGYVCAALPSRNPWSRINTYWIYRSGNKFGCTQVPKLGRGCVWTVLGRASRKAKQTVLDFRGVDTLCSQLMRLLSSAV